MEWPVLASLPEAERSRVVDRAQRRRFTRGDHVVSEGEPADALHLVASGRLAVRATTADGDSAILNILAPGDYFGELALMPGGASVRTATVVALEDVETLALSAAVFHELRERAPGVERLLTLLLARRVEELSARLVEAMYGGLDQRVHARLLELCRVYAPAGASRARLPLTQSEIAELAGGARPSVNQVLRRLEAEGLVVLRRGVVEVPDTAALTRWSAGWAEA